ncbi:uncharacterized protein BKA78DRAFT_318356 [Phyllosticta capitalensis]|uniref:uncharacterized protein n=1 Tax=Phyllosticta capitalensis TaxID=121624 RepID=UPI00312FF143
MGSRLIASMSSFDFWVGVFGLSPYPTKIGNDSVAESSFFNSLNDTGKVLGHSWSYTAGARYYSPYYYGSLIVAGYDASRLDATSTLTIRMSNQESGMFMVQVRKISIAGMNRTQPHTVSSNGLKPRSSHYTHISISQKPFVPSSQVSSTSLGILDQSCTSSQMTSTAD